MSKQSGAAKLIRKAKVIIWDKAPMAKRQTIETVETSFRDIMDIDKPFGGKVMVFGGDFWQVLPVVPKSTRAKIVNASLDGIPEESIIKDIFQNLQENAATTKYVTERAILASRNGHVDKINNKLISQFPGESKRFNSFDSAEDNTNNYYQEEYLNTLTPNGLPPHRMMNTRRNAMRIVEEVAVGGNQAPP
ncbi:uncharacterized protein LOC107013340 [Solanum pennellii]|uniref:ATP-dependent DNA helicase n=1 Tax=Solanum pennellii TaxID=28526 RepID=A0ABM1GBN6_SOLPN|nr:uncharacterized protein LOC107013340 [Solanum pennellii]